jgi:hypothetical protein
MNWEERALQRAEGDSARHYFENPKRYHHETAGTFRAISATQPCEDCAGAGGDGDDPSVGYTGSRCSTCQGTGVQQRNYLGEAFKIVAGESPMAPEPEHLKAVVEHCRKLASAVLTLPEVA